MLRGGASAAGSSHWITRPVFRLFPTLCFKGLKQWMGLVVLVVITTHCEPLSRVWTVRAGLKPNVPPAWLVACLYRMVNVCKYQAGNTLQPLLNPPCNGAGVRPMGDNSKVCGHFWVQSFVGAGRAAQSCCRLCLAIRQYLGYQTPLPHWGLRAEEPCVWCSCSFGTSVTSESRVNKGGLFVLCFLGCF